MSTAGGPAQSAISYHEATKHSPASVQGNRHSMEWAIKPFPFKVYTGLDPIALSAEQGSSEVPALEAIAAGGVVTPVGLDVDGLARLLRLSAGIIRRRLYAGGQTAYFRAAACTGALYHIDLYLVTGELDGLAAGLYHFGPHDFSLRRLRGGDLRPMLTEATGQEEAVSCAPVLVISTSTLWRNSWKYQSRAYRHCYWDNGTMLANLLAVAAADAIPARVVLGFVDESVSRLLDLDREKELPLSIVALGSGDEPAQSATATLGPLGLATEPLSSREIDYPAIVRAHEDSSLGSPDEVAGWRAGSVSLPSSAPPPQTTVTMEPMGALPDRSIDRVIVGRGSSRRFAHKDIGLDQLSTLLDSATGSVAFDIVGTGGPNLCDVYLIVNAVKGVAPGSYFFDREGRRLELLRPGALRAEAGFLGLGQELPRDASVNVYLLCDLEAVLAAYGARGYRAAQLEAAITGGRLYLAAYALGLGATGLTFFDDQVTEFFSPHAAGKAVMFLVAAGHGRKLTAGQLA